MLLGPSNESQSEHCKTEHKRKNGENGRDGVAWLVVIVGSRDRSDGGHRMSRRRT